jgi:PPOX class probable F420-dependent enzyme
MNEAELAAFLERPHLAVVATTRRDGAPHAVPVWYRYDGERVLIWTSDERAWVKHLKRDSRVAVTIGETAAPFGAVLIDGIASYHDGEAWIAEEIRAITVRYIPGGEVDAYIERWSGLGGMVAITPERIVSWGSGY